MNLPKKKKEITKVVKSRKRQNRVLLTGRPISRPSGQVGLIVIHERDTTDLVETKKTLDKERLCIEIDQQELNEMTLAELRSKKIVAGSQ